MRRTAAALGVVLLVALLPACGDVNKGTAFASEFQAFLDDRENLESAEATGTNPLPWSGSGDVSVQLVAGLSDDEIVDEVWEITAHEVENQVRYDLEVRFSTQTAGGDPALAAFHVGVPAPAPAEDEADLRAEIERRLELARTIVGFGIGETEASAGPSDFRMRSAGDAVTVAEGLCNDTGLERVIDSFVLDGPSPTGTVPDDTLEEPSEPSGPGSQVTLEDAGDCSWVPDVAEVLALVSAAGPVASYSASRPAYQDVTRLQVTLVPGVPADLAAAEARARELGLDLRTS